MELEQDSTVHPGGCVVETESGWVDARIDTQLDRMEKALLEGVRNE